MQRTKHKGGPRALRPSRAVSSQRQQSSRPWVRCRQWGSPACAVRTRPNDHRNTSRQIIDASNSCNGLRLYYQNVRGLKFKITECFVASSELGFEIYSFTETWLDSSVPTSQLFGSDYNVFRCDRSSANSRRSRGGEVLIAVSSKPSSSIVAFNTNSIESLWVRVSNDHGSFLIGTAYVPPEKSYDCTIIDLHFEALSDARLQHPACNVILLGDFNQPQLFWIPGQSNNMVLESSSMINSASATLLDGTTLNGVSQRNWIRNSQNRTLDLVFSDDSISISPIIEASDFVVPIDVYHPPLEIEIFFPNPITFVKDFDVSARYFNRADFDTMNRVLSEADWSEIQSCTDVDVAVCIFKAILDDAFDKSVPLVRPPLRPHWTNAHLKRLKQTRSKLLRKFSNSRCPCVKIKLNAATKCYRIYNRLWYRRYVHRTQTELRRNPKKFWKFVKSKRKKSVLQLNDRIAMSADEKCDLFAMHFASAFSVESPTASQLNATVTRLPIDVLDLDVFAVSEEMVLEAIINLKNSTTSGQDDIPAMLTGEKDKFNGPGAAE
ncbi:uncharacterized protein LOC129738320 [Uranotaenia lowii]|uniref:uncharacterized protein LOC129738320 n=1 Tax=Uranotaenia lowii TaxID=190385 RepID=UPI0024797908|nr:uncharacterized protein LOC129738320 [Uranotaenia lowii]